ncbi:NAD(P)H-dependent oxidoreductase [Nannocystis sp. ILAH1]|uniref:NADPH-dependent FMN reductase n=1 Tax=unclassified Nannocystis TaxID=2627009 RepID=UPI00226E86C3|nr:NAD(P)H-dependent oxidoreductase [Nannocystis sp. ILAH1]MCY1068377.1 NAD(P)H-dependent oxidoreductase [Nannocystis sp. RBIL2]
MSVGSSAKITIVSGSSRIESRVGAVVGIAAETVAAAGATVEVVPLHELALPVMVYGDRSQDDLPGVQMIRRHAAWADGFVICTPEYHGNMSGCLKNWFDFLYEELAGKFAGVLAVTGGGGGDMSITAVKTSFAWCHGFTLPYHVAARTVDFDAAGNLVNNLVADRIRRVAYDVVRYAPVVRGAFEAARRLGPGVEAGVAGAHT